MVGAAYPFVCGAIHVVCVDGLVICNGYITVLCSVVSEGVMASISKVVSDFAYRCGGSAFLAWCEPCFLSVRWSRSVVEGCPDVVSLTCVVRERDTVVVSSTVECVGRVAIDWCGGVT